MKVNSDLIANNFKELLDLESEKDHFIFKISGWERDHEYKLIDIDFEKEAEFIEGHTFDDTKFYNSKYFEQLIFTPNKESRAYHSLFQISIEDKENELTYEISRPSIEYIVACYFDLFQNKNCPSLILAGLPGRYGDNAEIDAKKNFRREFTRKNLFRNGAGDILYRNRNKRNIRGLRTVENEKKSYLFKNILMNLFRAQTVKISSKENLNKESFNKLSNSFLFSLSYNLNLPIMEFRYLKDQYKPAKRERSRDINAPRRIYNENLLYYYQQALSTQNPVLQYLSFYQIIEYFYYDVSNEDLVKEVKDTITNPDFSYKKLESIEKVIIKVKDWKFREKQATRLVLEKFLKLDELKNNLISYDKDYYKLIKSKGVKFAAAQKITESDKGIDVSSLSNRIYKVRNSLIHSKEGSLIFTEKERGVYIPFTEHEEELRREIPLMMFVAEQVIINSSKELNEANLNYD